MLREFTDGYRSFYIDENGFQGNYKEWFGNGSLMLQCYYRDSKLHGEYKKWGRPSILTEHCFFVDSKMHGEYKAWSQTGKLKLHCFFINGSKVSFKKLPLPTTPEELMYFKLKYDLQLLPKEQVC